MKIAIAQLNPTVGDIHFNKKLIFGAVQQSHQAGAELVVTSELVVSGYPPKDFLLREGFVAACDRAVEQLAVELPPGIGVLVGTPTHRGVLGGSAANGCCLLHNGAVQQTIHKALLPNYDVFDERRYFRPARQIEPISFRGAKLGVHICEDAWWNEPDTFYHIDEPHRRDPVAELAAQDVDLFINLSASPFEVGKLRRRSALLRRHLERHSRPFVFVNQVGGNDDLVFDGHSMVWSGDGHEVLRLPGFSSQVHLFDLSRLPPPLAADQSSDLEQLLEALVLGLGDYCRKSGFTDCVLGLSGGIDSALAAYIAAEAVGPTHVHGLLMPSRYSSAHSVADAQQLATAIGLNAQVIPIDLAHCAYESLPVLGPELLSAPTGIAQQNLQSRIRGAIVMSRSNHLGWLPLATGNKSELAMGYCTLYGDMAGGFAVLADLLKRDVYALARYINEVRERREVIPRSTIEKAPSAELAPDQFDQQTLPPYDLLDAILEGLIEDELSVTTLQQRFPAETVQWVADRLDRNEYKRRQIPPGIKLSARAFGSGRRMPIAARYRLD
jgi:NAD+ synthase (glutamine-hydrolysing)